MLAPVMDFEKRTATELYANTLPPEVQKAIKDKRVLAKDLATAGYQAALALAVRSVLPAGGKELRPRPPAPLRPLPWGAAFFCVLAIFLAIAAAVLVNLDCVTRQSRTLRQFVSR